MIPTRHNPITLVYTRTCGITFKMSKTQIIGGCSISSMSSLLASRFFLVGQVFVNLTWVLHILSFILQKFQYSYVGMYAISIATLFWLPCLNPIFHTSPHWRKMTWLGFGLEWIEIMEFAPMTIFSQEVACKNRCTLFYVNIIILISIY